MRKTSFKRLFAGFLAVFLLWCGSAASAASDTSSDAASKIQLVAAEGSVTIQDSSSKTVSLNSTGENRLYSGYHIITGADSYAWFSLDETKTVKLDASSEVEIRSRRRKLQLLLISGALYCNVSAPLNSNETYEIRTSDTITGIRGTSVGVDIGRTVEGKDTITVFHGTVEVRFTDPALADAPSVWVSEGEFLSYGQSDGAPEAEAPAPVEEISEFFAEAMEEDGFSSPWPVKPAEENVTVETPPTGNVSNLFVDGGEPETDDNSSWNDGVEPDQVPEQESDPDPDPEPDPDQEPGQDPEKTFTVIWKDSDGTVLETDTGVVYGEKPSYDGELPSKEANAQYSYEFSGWSPSVTEVVGDAEYFAVYSDTPRTYTVTWKNSDGSILEQDTGVSYGDMPSYDGSTPTKEADAQYTYEFNNAWSPTVTEVTGDTEYIAEYTSTLRSYTVTWKNSDGSILEQDTVPYGNMPSYDGSTPTKEADAQYTYEFNNAWSPIVTEVAGDTEYIAEYTGTLRTYTVTWKDSDGTVLETDREVEFGQTPSFDGNLPSFREGEDGSDTLAFSYWKSEKGTEGVEQVSGDASYTAVFAPAYKLTLSLEAPNGKCFGTMSETILSEQGFSPVIIGEDTGEYHSYSKWCVKGREFTLPDASAVSIQQDMEGYFFLGWHDEESKTSESVVSVIGEDNEGDRMLYALYAVDEEHIGYDVLFWGNGYASLSFGYYNPDYEESMPYQVPAEGFTESPWASLADSSQEGKPIEITSLNVEFMDILRPVSMAYWFSGLSGCESIDFYYLDTSLVTDMNHLFAGSSMQALNLRSFDTAKVTNMAGMFEDCAELSTIFASDSFVVSGVPADSELFSGCSNLIGGEGTEFSDNHTTAEYARIDGGEEKPGYFTLFD